MEAIGEICDDEDERTSSAPLHLAYPCRKWIGGDELALLRETFPNIITTEWTRREEKRLKKNWKHIVRHYPDYSDPKYAFAVGHDIESQLQPAEVTEKRERYKKFGVMFRMAYRLDNRLMCDIYAKCRRMFYNKSYFFSSRAQVPPELEKIIKHELSLNESTKMIAYKYNVSPNVILTIKKRPKRKKRFRWTEEAVDDLRQAISSIYQFDEFQDLLSRDINWKRIQARMETSGHTITWEQCYNKWIHLYPGSKIRIHDPNR